MNRKDRRKQRAIERQLGRRLDARESASFEAGLRAAKTATMPPRYYEAISKLARAMLEWLHAEPKRPELVWHDMMTTDTVMVGPLQGEALKYLAGSPDAIRMLEWVDERTGGIGTLYQATWALKLIGQLGGPELEAKFQSEALKNFTAFARGRTTDTRIAPSPCPQCGKTLDGESSAKGHVPEPGDYAVCVYCGTICQFDEALRHVLLSDADLQALPADFRAQLEDTAALFREARARHGLGSGKPRTVPEA